MTVTRSISRGSLGIPNSGLPGEPAVPGWVHRLVERGVEHPVHHIGRAEFRASDAGQAALVTARVPDVAGFNRDGLRDATRAAYEIIMRQLGTLRARHAVRFWNFIPGIHEPLGGGLDRYMAFNAGRFEALRGPDRGSSGTTPTAAIPTATGIGHSGPDLVVHCLSLATPGRPVENPRQVPAYRYSNRFGPLPPCFARATAVTLPGESREVLLVGGTASVVGEDSWHRHNLGRQFQETCQNLQSLIDAWDQASGAAWAGRFRELRIYGPSLPTSPAQVGALVHESFGADTEIEFVVAQLCRDELLIEIEGVVAGQRHLGAGAAGEGEP